MYFEYIQSILLIISAIFMIIAAVGIISLKDDMKNVVYARIHIVGVFDMACILAMIGLGQYLLAGIYFILAPFTAHAMGYAFFKSEDSVNNENVVSKVKLVAEKIESPFSHPKAKLQEFEKDNFDIGDKTDDSFSVTTLEISEDE